MPFSPHLDHIAGGDQFDQRFSTKVLEHTHSHCIVGDIPVGLGVHPLGVKPV